MSLPDTGAGQPKTTGIRFPADRHAALTLIARLRHSSLQDEVMKACDAHIAGAKTDPELVQQAEEAQAAIDAEAREQRATLASLFSDKPQTPAKPAKATSARAGDKP